MNCEDCILDLTDACPKGSGRAIDDEICEDFLSEHSITKGEYCKQVGIHFYKPLFNLNDEADEEFKQDINDIIDAIKNYDDTEEHDI